MSDAETQAPVAVIGQLELVNAAGPRFEQVKNLLEEKGIAIVFPKDMPKEPPVETPVEEPEAEPKGRPGNAAVEGSEATTPDGSDSIEGGDGVDGVV